jgi:hypothetical protein
VRPAGHRSSRHSLPYNRPVSVYRSAYRSVYRFPRRALTHCQQLCMGIQPGARFPALSVDALPATLYGHSAQSMYRNRPILQMRVHICDADVACNICGAGAIHAGSRSCEDMVCKIHLPGTRSMQELDLDVQPDRLTLRWGPANLITGGSRHAARCCGENRSSGARRASRILVLFTMRRTASPLVLITSPFVQYDLNDTIRRG